MESAPKEWRKQRTGSAVFCDIKQRLGISDFWDTARAEIANTAGADEGRVGKDAPRPHKDDGFTMRDIWGGNSAVLQIGTKALAMAYLIVYAI